MRRTLALLAALVVLVPACSSSSADGEGTCSPGAYPPAPSGATSVVHVSSACTGGDGSATAPYGSLTAGLAAAPEGAVLLVAPGTYKENVVIRKPVTIVGTTDASKAELAGIILQAPAPYALVANGAGAVVVRGVRVAGATGVGIWATGATTLDVEGSAVEDTKASADAAGGFGVYGSDGATLNLRTSTVTGSTSIGAYLSGARGIILQNQVRKNGAGGVRVEDGTAEIRIEGNDVSGNVDTGISVFSSRAIILQNQARDTTLGKNAGDGILIGKTFGSSVAADVQIEKNEVTGNARVGILVDTGSGGIILQNNASQNGVNTAKEFGAGIWLQGASVDFTVEGNTMDGNRFLGLGLTGGAHGIILQNVVRNTVQAEFIDKSSVQFAGGTAGDGMGIYRGAVASVGVKAGAAMPNTITGADMRVGILVDDAGMGTNIGANTVSPGSEGAIILQHQPSGTVTAQGAVTTLAADKALPIHASDLTAASTVK